MVCVYHPECQCLFPLIRYQLNCITRDGSAGNSDGDGRAKNVRVLHQIGLDCLCIPPYGIAPDRNNHHMLLVETQFFVSQKIELVQNHSRSDNQSDGDTELKNDQTFSQDGPA